MNPIILLPAIGKYQVRLSSLTLVWQPVLKTENSELKPVRLGFEVDLVSHPACAEEFGKYILCIEGLIPKLS